MKHARIILCILSLWIIQISCIAPAQSYSGATPIPNDILIPTLVNRKDKYNFVIMTKPEITCNAGIGFWDQNDRWSFSEFPKKKADETGRCEWEWQVPPNAKTGTGVFRGFVENESQSTDFIPKTFCIDQCP